MKVFVANWRLANSQPGANCGTPAFTSHNAKTEQRRDLVTIAGTYRTCGRRACVQSHGQDNKGKQQNRMLVQKQPSTEQHTTSLVDTSLRTYQQGHTDDSKLLKNADSRLQLVTLATYIPLTGVRR